MCSVGAWRSGYGSAQVSRALLRLAPGLLAQVLLDRVREVLATDARPVVGGVDELGHVEHVVEPVGIALFDVVAARSVEVLQGGESIATIDGSAGLAELSVGVRGHGGEEPYRFRHDSDTHARGSHG